MSSNNLKIKTQRTYWLPAAIASAFFAIALFAVITYVNTTAIRDSEKSVAQAYVIREATQQLLSAMKDAETGQRGYLLTGDPSFLEPHNEGSAKANRMIHDLIELTVVNNDTRPFVLEMQEALEKQHTHLTQTIELRKKAPESKVSDEVLELVKSGRGQQSMTAAHDAAKKILSIEEAKLAESEVTTQERTAVSQTTITIGNVLALGLVTFAGFAALLDRKKRDQAEYELQKQQNELQAVIESAFEGILTYGDDLKVRYLNPAAAEILLIDIDQKQSHPRQILDFIPPMRREHTKKKIDDFMTSGQKEISFQNILLLRSDGSEFFCEGTAIRTIADQDHFTTLKFRDVSETQRLKARQREYAAVLGQFREAIIVCDLQDRIQSWNKGAEFLFGLAENDVVGKDVRELVFKGRLDEWNAGRSILMAKGNYSATFHRSMSDGREMVIENRRSLINDENDQPIAQLMFMVDVTDRVREEAKERRSQRLESIGTLAGGVAHDLNNVLTPIIMSAKLLKRGSKTPERLIDNIVTSADRGAKMIKKLLAFAGGEKSARQHIDVRETLVELEDILSHTLPTTIDLQVKIPASLRKVDADRTELSQVVMNLAINARDAMPSGGTLAIEVCDFYVDESRAVRSDNLTIGPHVLLTIADTGEGIPREIIDRIFDPFFTTKAQGKGTGLGLATTIGIVRSYSGDISVYSEPGLGSKFSILLPTSSLELAIGAVSEVEMESDVPIGKGETILIVDDESMILDTARETLEANQYRVIASSNGVDAIRVFLNRSEEIDVVLLDMMMPGLNGPEIKEKLRNHDLNAKIISSSGLRRPSSDSSGGNDFDGFLPKPYTDEQLLRLIRDVLDRQSSAATKNS